jgi:hypothetical protein
MLSYLKSDPGHFILQYSKGRKIRSGVGLCFWYFSPTNTIIKVPVNSNDAPFIFDEVTADYQEITVQGEVTFRIREPELAASVLDYSLGIREMYMTDDPQKPSKRLINSIKVFIQEELQTKSLKEILKGTENLTETIFERLKNSSIVEKLGLEILSFNILALKANPETMRALEATIREDLLKNADEALYDRRNASVEQERSIKENEFNTEIAVQRKKQEIEENKLAAKRKLQNQRSVVEQERMSAEIELEEKNKDLVTLQSSNDKQKADSKAYALKALLDTYEKVDPKKIQALAMMKMDSHQLIASAFNELAENAGKIGELNISPDLLKTLLEK